MPRRKKTDETDADGGAEETRSEPAPGDKPKVGRPRGRRPKASIEKEMREQFQAFLGVAALMWSTSDQVCSASLAENSEAIAAGLARLCAKSKYAQKIASSLTDMAVWGPFGAALARFGTCIYEHHIAMPEPAPHQGGPYDVPRPQFASDSPASPMA